MRDHVLIFHYVYTYIILIKFLRVFVYVNTYHIGSLILQLGDNLIMEIRKRGNKLNSTGTKDKDSE